MNGIQEVSGSIPLISTKANSQKSQDNADSGCFSFANDETSSTMEAYFEARDGVYSQYMHYDDTWNSSTMEASDYLSLYENNGSVYLKNATDMTIVGTETINGMETVVLKGNVELESVTKQLQYLLGDRFTVDAKMPITFYIPTSDLEMVQMAVDLKQVYEIALEATESNPDEPAPTVNNATLKVTINAIDDDVEDFTIPAEVYTATPAESQAAAE